MVASLLRFSREIILLHSNRGSVIDPAVLHGRLVIHMVTLIERFQDFR